MAPSSATAYFSQFQLGLTSLDIPQDYFFVYGYWVLKAYGYALIVLYAFWLGIQYVPRAIMQRYTMYLKPAMPLAVLLAVLLLFGLFYHFANQLAKDRFEEQQSEDYLSYPAVQIWLTTDPKTPESLRTLAKQLHQGCYRLLFHNKDIAFVFRPKRNWLGNLAVTAVPQYNIRSLRILPRYQSYP